MKFPEVTNGAGLVRTWRHVVFLGSLVLVGGIGLMWVDARIETRTKNSYATQVDMAQLSAKLGATRESVEKLAAGMDELKTALVNLTVTYELERQRHHGRR